MLIFSGARRRALVAAGAGLFGLASLALPAPAGAIAGTPAVSLSPSSLAFGDQRVNTYGAEKVITVTNTGSAPLTISDLQSEAGDPFDYALTSTTTCVNFDSNGNVIPGTPVAPSGTCKIALVFSPVNRGSRPLTLKIVDNASDSPQRVQLSGNGTVGYYMAGLLGETAAFGDAIDHGDATDLDLNAPIVDMAATPGNGDGYWLLGLDGGIFSYGNAKFHGSTGSIPLNAPVMTMAPSLDNSGYWLAAFDGGIFAFDVPFYGSMGGKPLNQPIVGMAPTPTGKGYYLVASDGGIFAFGDAKFFGSMGGKPLNKPIRAMGVTPTGNGYWLVATDGGIFAFGDAKFYGSTGALTLNEPIVDFAVTPTGRGYWLLALDGGLFSFGDAPFLGSLGGSGVDDAISIAGTAPMLDPVFLGPENQIQTAVARRSGSLHELAPSAHQRLTSSPETGAHTSAKWSRRSA
jgi:hypothetical protein